MRPAWSRWIGIALVWVACSCGLSPLWAQDLQPVPPLAARVLDATGTLDASQRQALEAKLAEIEQAKGSQVVILMVPTTAPEDIASYANRVGNTWKIGRKEVGDGVLVVVALGDRKVRIEVAKTLEGAIPDLAARQIIERAITPRFKLADFAGGLNAAVDQIGARIKGEPLPPVPEPAATGQNGGEGFQLFDLAIFLFIAVPLIGAVTRGIFGRKLGALLTGGGVGALALWITSSLLLAALAALAALLFSLFSSFKAASSGRGWGTGGGGGWSSGHGSWGSGGGGGFGSGGGGDFGGGGASGDW